MITLVFWVILPSKVTFGLVDFKIDRVVGLVNVNLPMVVFVRDDCNAMQPILETTYLISL